MRIYIKMKSNKINPELIGWKKCFENEGLLSYHSEIDDKIKLNFNKVENLWFVLVEMGIYMPVFIGNINSDKELKLITSNVCFDKKKISNVIKLNNDLLIG